MQNQKSSCAKTSAGQAKFKTCPVKLFTMFNSSYLTWNSYSTGIYPVKSNFYFTGIIFLTILLFGFFGVVKSSQAANIYVDRTLSADCVSGNYSTTSRDCSGSDGDAYTTVQSAIDNMQPADHIYLRGGTYQEGYINLTSDKNPTNGNWDDNYNLLASYPGEWAVLDGQGSSENRGTVIGNPGYYGEILSYWKFERLEITGGGNPNNDGAAAGFWGTRGPFWFTHCYIHDNYARWAGTPGSANPGGLKGHIWHDSIVEYCWFERNGALNTNNHNCADINIYSDYVEDPTNVNIENAVRNNTFRYNYFVDSPVAIKYKNSQWLSLDNTGTHTTYNYLGDKIHHNIFKDHWGLPIDNRQDFAQIYNNIFDDSKTNEIVIGEAFSADREPFYSVVYNNLFKNSRLSYYYNYDSDGSSYPIGGGNQIHPHSYTYNNIFESVGPESNGRNDLNLFFTWSDWTESDVNMSTIDLENNLFWPRSFSDEIINLADNDNDYSATGWLSDGKSEVVYTSESPGLHPTGENYKTNPNFQVDGTNTIANGGIGGLHPYLSGVTIPSYVGAVNPNDNDWVDGVLGLANVDYLKNSQEGDPDWIEGSGTQSDTTPPSHPTGLSVS